jgi:hypothetical protein
MQDTGDCAAASQQRQRLLKIGLTATAISFLEPGTRVAANRITPDDIAALDAEVTRLEASPCPATRSTLQEVLSALTAFQRAGLTATRVELR